MGKEATRGMERILSLFDAGTFVETGAFIKRTDGEFSGVVSGYGAIGGKLVYAFAQDSDVEKGAFDGVQADKICALYQMAIKNGAPVIGIFDSIGAKIGDGASAMSAYGKLLKSVGDASGVVPQIALIAGVCSGLSATVASMFDITVTVKDTSKLFVGAPFLLGKKIGTSEAVAANGLSSMTAGNEADAANMIRELIAVLPASCEDDCWIENTADDVNRKVALQDATGAELIRILSDGGKFLEIGDAYAPELTVGFACFGGVSCGVIANNASENGGVITADAAKKAAKMISLCDSFSTPIVTLTDSNGVELNATAENAALAAQLGKLAMAYATADTAKVTVVTGHAYGAAFTLMGSKGLGADMVYALQNAKISVMDPAAAVAFLWNDRITADTTRESLEEKWKNECATATAAAADGSIDDVIADEELRQRICAAIYMLTTKNTCYPDRKHCNLPL